MTSRTWWRIAQGIAVVAVLAYVARTIARQWASLAALPGAIRVDWSLVLGSGLVVVASYAVLIWTWQRTVLAWGERLSFRDAARIWFVSNLGKYVPGKVWSIGAMGVLAQRAGVSPVAAVGSSLVVSIVNVLSGVAVAAVFGLGTFDVPTWAEPVLALLAAGVIAAPWLLPAAGRVASALLRREIRLPHLPHTAVWTAAVGCGVAWVLYGAAFRIFHIAILGRATGTLAGSTAAFTGSYILGFLALFAPGGIGVREVFLQTFLERFGIASGAEAWLVVLASRVWLTIIEVIPGLLYLAIGRQTNNTSSDRVA